MHLENIVEANAVSEPIVTIGLVNPTPFMQPEMTAAVTEATAGQSPTLVPSMMAVCTCFIAMVGLALSW